MAITLAQSAPLKAAGTRHGFFGRQGGLSEGVFAALNVSETGGDELERVTANRARAAAALHVAPEALATLTQVHSARVLTLTVPPVPGERPEADAMVTTLSGIALGILTADCAPVLLADPVAGVIAAAHAGWKGAVDGIIENTVAAMVALGADRARIVAAIGPTISAAHYEVGPEFAAGLLARHPDAVRRILRPNGGREHFDLPGFVLDRLAAAGVTQVEDTAHCTYADSSRYFSHRRATHENTTTGRQISLIGRR